jgi:hypothetical protein
MYVGDCLGMGDQQKGVKEKERIPRDEADGSMLRIHI